MLSGYFERYGFVFKGLDRHLGCGRWSMLVAGRPAPIVGRVCMDSCKYLPLTVESAESHNREKAEAEGFWFVDKNSKKISVDLRHILEEHMGFGDFIFRDPKTKAEVMWSGTPHLPEALMLRAFNGKEFPKAFDTPFSEEALAALFPEET